MMDRRDYFEAMRAAGHVVATDEDGDPNIFFYEGPNCNGPGCSVCNWSRCWHCHADPATIPACDCGKAEAEREAVRRIRDAAPEMYEAGTAHEDPQLWRVSWLEGLLTELRKPAVIDAIMAQDGNDDRDALYEAISEAEAFARDYRAALSKASPSPLSADGRGES